MATKNLAAAKKAKNDEFYTQLGDIEREMSHYKKHFYGKKILLNCDDPEESNFWRYFEMFFDEYQLEKLTSTHYHATDPTYKLEMIRGKDVNNDGKMDKNDIIRTPLISNGDFRAAECIELLDEADIVITNPPFSLFREYVSLLVEHNKSFIILGNMNALTYKEIFPLVKEDKMWGGFSFNKTMEFIMPDDYELKGKAFIDENGKKHGFVPAICWYTNLDIDKRHDPLPLAKKYEGHEDEYPKYDNYDAIEVGKVNDIPRDYYGVMGVPITFMNNYCPEQFEILGLTQRGCHDEGMETKQYDDYWEMRPNGTRTGSSGSKTNGNPNLAMNDGKHNYFVNADGHIVQSRYQRIFIKRTEQSIQEDMEEE